MRQPLHHWAWVLFFFSGLTGLVYEILWTRRLTLVFGHSILAVSTVVTAYMGGLALGSLFGGRAADQRVRSGLPSGWYVKTYGALEIFVGLWGLLSLPLLGLVESAYYHLAAQGMSNTHLGLLTFLLSLLALLPPTIAMGATLPVVGCLFSADREGVGNQLARLYSLNTWGAVCGAALAGFVLLPWLGLRASIMAAACINFAIGLLGLRLGNQSAPLPEQPQELPLGSQAGSWLPLVFGLSGFSSMIFQLGWTRALALSLGGAIYAFSAILVVFLGGIAAGSALYSRLFRNRKLSSGHLGWVCLGLGVTGGLSVVLLGHLPLIFAAALPSFYQNYSLVILLDLLICGLVLLPPTLLMGLSFPLVTHLYHENQGALGRSIGDVYSANTLGCIAGSFGCGFFGLPWLGVQNSLQLAVSVNLVAALICAVHGKRPRALSLISLSLLVLTWLTPRWSTGLISGGAAIYGRDPALLMKRPDPLFYRDGLTCSVALEFNHPDTPSLRVNGKVDASMAVNDRVNMTLTGLFPLLYLERVERAGVIGLGSGTTLGTLAGSSRVKRVECAELEKAVIDCQPYWSPYLDYFDRDPKIHTFEADGRTFILGSRERFDLLLSEPSNPWIAGIGNLYTREFYQACRTKLNDTGVFLQWCNLYALSTNDLKMVLRTFFSVFPEGEIWLGGGDLMLIGSPGKLVCRPARLREYWETHPSLRYNMAEFGFLQPEEVLGQYVCSWDAACEEVGDGPLNTDDRPLLEYSAPRSLYRSVLEVNFRWVQDLRLKANALPGQLSRSPERTLQLRLGNAACVFRNMVSIPIDADLPPEYKELFRGFVTARSVAEIPGDQDLFWKRFPNFSRGRLEWARRALETGYTAKVLDLLPEKLAQQLAPQELFLFRQLSARASVQTGRWAQAAENYRDLYRLRPDCVAASNLADCYRHLQDRAQCDHWSKLALKLNPYDARAHFEQGWLKGGAGDALEAERLTREALRICPYLLEAWVELARILAETNRTQEAGWALRQAERYSNDEATAEHFRAMRRATGL